MTITQAEIDALRRKAEEAIRLEVASSEHDEEWCAKHHNLRCYANPQRITRLIDAHKAQAERIETLEGALRELGGQIVELRAAARPIRDNSDEIVKASLRMSGDIHALLTRAALGETEEG